MSWVQPPELGTSPPRPVRLTGGGIVLLVVALVVLAGGVVLGLTIQNRSTQQSQALQMLEEQGAEIDATVTRLWLGGGKAKTHRVGYQFQTEGKVIRGDAAVSRKMWESLSEGARVRVRFLPVEPMINRPMESAPNPVPIWLSWAIPAVAGAISLFMWRSVRRQRHLLQNGRMAMGTVTRVSTVRSNKIIQYEFDIPGGPRASGKGGGKPGAKEVGSQVTIIYDPQNPKRNGPYPFDLVRPIE